MCKNETTELQHNRAVRTIELWATDHKLISCLEAEVEWAWPHLPSVLPLFIAPLHSRPSQTYFYFTVKYILGSFQRVHHYVSPSLGIVNYNSNFEHILLGLGETYDEIVLERKDFSTGDYVQSSALTITFLYSNLYSVHVGTYRNCRCANTGQHRFKVRTNGVNTSYYDFSTVRLRGE